MSLLRSFSSAFTRTQRTAGIALAQLSARAAADLRLFIGTVSRAAIDRQHALDFGMRPWNHVNADQFSDTSRGSRAGVGRSFDCAHIATHKHRHISRADVLLA